MIVMRLYFSARLMLLQAETIRELRSIEKADSVAAVRAWYSCSTCAREGEIVPLRYKSPTSAQDRGESL